MYQVYPRSYADSDGDGIGDLRGVIDRLDYLVWLGVSAIWLNPIMDSPNADWGYDISDYTSVHPELGTMRDLDELVRRAGDRNIKVILDLVPNHTSDRHRWFQDARSSRDAPHRDWYVWADGKPDGGPPNNWLSVFGGDIAWTYDEVTNQWYLHNFLAQQPDLNWWNEEVREAFDHILRFWFEHGVAGFRIDVAHALIKDRSLRDNLPTTDDDHPDVRRVGQRSEYNMNRPEVHDILKRWRVLADSYDPQRILIGETYVLELEKMVGFYGAGHDELNLAFNFPFAHSEFEIEQLRTCVEATYALLPGDAWPAWMASNHDVGRLASRWCGEDEQKIRCALVLLLCLCGTAFLYYGDEIGLCHGRIAESDVKDPVGKRFWPEAAGRDPARTPMQWTPDRNGGFCPDEATPWMPVGNAASCNVASQRDDPGSILRLCRDLIRLRRDEHDLGFAPYERVAAPRGAWAWRRGTSLLVAVNMSSQKKRVEGPRGRIVLSSRRDRDGDEVHGVELRPWEAVLVRVRDGAFGL